MSINNVKKKLGDLLVDVGMISAEQLDKAITIQKQSGKRLGEVLIEMGFITNDDMIQVLEFQLGIPHVNLEKYEIDKEVCLKIPESIARRHGLIPIAADNGILKLAMSDPLNVFAIDDVRIFSGMEVQPVIASLDAVNKAIDKYYSTQKAMKAVEDFKKEQGLSIKISEDAEAVEGEGDINSAPTVKLVNSIIEQAVRGKASDIHVEPFEHYIKIRYRTDGLLCEVMRPEIEVLPAILARIKILGGMNIAEKRAPQDGRINVVVDNKEFDLRVSIIPTIYGEKVVIRIVDKFALVLSKDRFGFNEQELDNYNKMLKAPHGLILVSGPTGSGKSTTLYSAINEINRPDINIITIEDPVEGRLDGVNQVQVYAKTGLTFAAGLRSILRQDPDVIMIGEIRDSETAEIAVKSAITGHLVLSTIHTNDAPGSVLRLIDMGIERYMVASSLVGVIAQRLMKKVCINCKREHTATAEEIKGLGLETGTLIRLAAGKGCPVCGGTGYKGRFGVYELMYMTGKHRELINSGCTEDELRELSIKTGMNVLKESAKRNVLNGISSYREYERLSHTN